MLKACESWRENASFLVCSTPRGRLGYYPNA
nr:MAG TPA: hypothetical protein [Caudoviricetes sp.]